MKAPPLVASALAQKEQGIDQQQQSQSAHQNDIALVAQDMLSSAQRQRKRGPDADANAMPQGFTGNQRQQRSWR